MSDITGNISETLTLEATHAIHSVYARSSVRVFTHRLQLPISNFCYTQVQNSLIAFFDKSRAICLTSFHSRCECGALESFLPFQIGIEVLSTYQISSLADLFI